MSLQEELNRLVNSSKKIATFTLAQSDTQVPDALIQRRQTLVRDAEPHENKLAAYCMGDTSLATIIETNEQRDDIHPALLAAFQLNQICCNPNMANRIEELGTSLGDRKLNLDYLRQGISKIEAEIERVTQLNTEKNTNNTEDHMDREFLREEAIIQRMEQDLKDRRLETKKLQQRKEENLKVQRDCKDLENSRKKTRKANTLNDAIGNERISRLEKEIELKNQQLDALEVTRTTTTFSSSKQSTSMREAYTGFRARIEKLLNSNSDHDENTNMQELIATLKAIETELQDILNRMNTIETRESHVKMVRNIYTQLLTYIHEGEKQIPTVVDLHGFNQLFPHNQHITVPILKLPKESILLTSLLLKLLSTRDMSVVDLTNYLKDVAKQHEIPVEQAGRIIHNLDAVELITIDRSHTNGLVLLNFI